MNSISSVVHRVFKSRVLMVGIASATIAMAFGAVASASRPASIPTSKGIIYACFDKSSHVLRVLDPYTSTCTRTQRLLTWSQAGPPGSRGARGVTGSAGTNGATGSAGVTGSIGATGVTGATGTTGTIGATGVTGAQGPQGLAGSRGDFGATGPSGPSGLTWRGTWMNGSPYRVNDAVSYGGSAWIALAPNWYSVPSLQNTSWDLLAQQGATGAVGVPGATGPQGIPGTPAMNLSKVVSSNSATTTGKYAVSFAQPVSTCTYQATFGGQAYGFISATPDVDPMKVDVQIHDTSGVLANAPFYLTVFC